MTPSPVPARLGRYEIVQRLSAGGMGEVFVARFAGPGGFIKPVALKRIHPHLALDEAFIHMLHDEANVTAAIKHPNVVQTVDVGVEGENHYMVLDFVSGETLSRLRRDVLKKGVSIPPWLVAWVGAETASALHAAHEARSLSGEPLEIVHRDVSLANIMLADDGRPMLFDFGVAKAKQRASHTMAGELKGKLAYMAPEVLKGVPVNRTVDVFSLGVVLYELLTLRSPFMGETDLETIAALQAGQAPPPHAIRADVDQEMSGIVMKAMAAERDKRFASAAELEAALRGWARKRHEPHDVSAAAAWLAETFPDRIEDRKKLLHKVATFVPSAPTSQSPSSLTTSWPGLTPASMSGLSVRPMTPTGGYVPGVTDPATLASANTSSSIGEPPRPPSKVWVAVAVGTAVLAVGMAGLAFTLRAPAEHVAVAVAASAPPTPATSAPPAETAPVAAASAEPAAAPSASQAKGAPAAASTGGKAGAKAATTATAGKPDEAPRTKTKIRRGYDD